MYDGRVISAQGTDLSHVKYALRAIKVIAAAAIDMSHEPFLQPLDACAEMSFDKSIIALMMAACCAKLQLGP
jgi:hypothetical protein